MTAPRTIAIGLLWHSANSGNLGVGALTVANIWLVRQAAARAGLVPSFIIMGPRQPTAANVSGADISTLDIDTRALVVPNRYWTALAHLDCVLDIGAGDSFADIYGLKRFGFLWLTKAMVIARRRPLLLSPQTIGPFDGGVTRWLASAVMRRAFAVVARDPLSFDVARAMAPGTRTIASVDVAFALPYEPVAQSADKIDVGVNVSGLLFGRNEEAVGQFGMDVDYPALSRALLSELCGRTDLRVHLICHVNAPELPTDDDGRAADLLAAEFPSCIRVPDFASPSDAKSYIAGLDFLVAGRMHACIAAFSSGVPVVPIAYSRKFTGLFEGVLGYPHIVPVKGVSTADALQFILDRLDRRADLAQEVAAGNRVVADALAAYDAELDRLFASLT